jgi:hypothetical protein
MTKQMLIAACVVLGAGAMPAFIEAMTFMEVRAEERIHAGTFRINGVQLESVRAVVENGHKLAEYRAALTVHAVRNPIAAARK